jgi:hypothetical protein
MSTTLETNTFLSPGANSPRILAVDWCADEGRAEELRDLAISRNEQDYSDAVRDLVDAQNAEAWWRLGNKIIKERREMINELAKERGLEVV